MPKVPVVQVNQEELVELNKALKVATKLVTKLNKNFKLTKEEWSKLESAGYDFNVLAHNVPQNIH